MMIFNYYYNNYKNSYKRVLKSFFLLMLYFITVKFPYLPLTYEMVPYINVKEMFIYLGEMISFSVLFNASITIFLLHVFGRLIDNAKLVLLGKFEFKSFEEVEGSKLFINKIIDALDVSNPFLYSYKTRGLLE